jgi:hypothetical protein
MGSRSVALPTTRQKDVVGHETETGEFENAPGLEGVNVVTVSKSAEAELLETARSPVAIAATSRTDDNRRRANEMDLESGRDMTHLSERMSAKCHPATEPARIFQPV